MRQTLYSVLGVSRDADDGAIRSAYRRRALATHPDKGGNAAEFLAIVDAFEVLSDTTRRTVYNEELRRTGSADGFEIQQRAPECCEPVATVHVRKVEERAESLWQELLQLAPDKCAARVESLSCRVTEAILTHARSRGGGVPIVVSDRVSVEPSGVEEGCGMALLSLSRRDLDGAEPEPKRAKRVIERATKVWISLDGFKICTGTSDDLWEAINWHIMLVRMKQLFDERIKAGHLFDDAVRTALNPALREKEASDPRLRFVTEVPWPTLLFTPATPDLETALRRHAELVKLRGAPREDVLAAIHRMTVNAPETRVVPLLEEQLKRFRRLFRWHWNRPEGVNATCTAGQAAAYAEFWSECGNEPVCRGPKRKSVAEALEDLKSLTAAFSTGGEDTVKVEAQRLYKESMKEFVVRVNAPFSFDH